MEAGSAWAGPARLGSGLRLSTALKRGRKPGSDSKACLLTDLDARPLCKVGHASTTCTAPAIDWMRIIGECHASETLISPVDAGSGHSAVLTSVDGVTGVT